MSFQEHFTDLKFLTNASDVIRENCISWLSHIIRAKLGKLELNLMAGKVLAHTFILHTQKKNTRWAS